MKKSAFIVPLSIVVTCLASGPTRAAENDSASPKVQPNTLTGCLNGPDDDGGFKLETPSEQVTIGGPVALLQGNAGKQVRVTGDWIATGEGKSDAASRDDEGAQERAFKAEKIETIAADCSSGR